VSVRAVRGATHVDADDREHVLALARELIEKVMTANELTGEDLISLMFTPTPDLSSVAPAVAARQLGLDEVALLYDQEMAVDDSMTRVIRLPAHVQTDRSQRDLTNVYLHGTQGLRADVPAILHP